MQLHELAKLIRVVMWFKLQMECEIVLKDLEIFLIKECFRKLVLL